jgi:hypothetical protein
MYGMAGGKREAPRRVLAASILNWLKPGKTGRAAAAGHDLQPG